MAQISSLRTEIKFKKTEIGEIPVDWEISKLGKLAFIQGGFAFESKDYKTNGVPLVRISNITSNGIKLDECVFLSYEFLQKYKNFQIELGDILVAMSGATTGKIGVFHSNLPVLLNQRVGRFVIKETNRLDKKYLAHIVLTKKFKEHLLKDAEGGAQPNVSGRSIENIFIPLPPLPEQKKIAEILSIVDEAIEKKKEAIEKTKELKKGLMQELLTRGIGHIKFKETDIGKIPEEWELVNLNKIGKLKGGGGFPEKYQGYTDKEYLFIKVSDMNLPQNDIYIKKSLNTIDEEILKKLGCNLFPKDSIIFAKVGAALLLNRRRILTSASCIDNNMMGLIVNRENDPKFYFYILQRIDFAKYVFPGALPSVNQSVLGNIRVVRPSKTEQNKIVQKITSIDEKIEAEIKQNEKLQVVRKGLMQVLLTGKIRVNLKC